MSSPASDYMARILAAVSAAREPPPNGTHMADPNDNTSFIVRCADCGTAHTYSWGKSGKIVAPRILRAHGWEMTGQSSAARWHCPPCKGREFLTPSPVGVRKEYRKLTPRKEAPPRIMRPERPRPASPPDDRYEMNRSTRPFPDPCWKCGAAGYCEHRKP